MKQILKADNIQHVHSDIRGPVYEESLRLRAQGIDVLRLNTGNPGVFGFSLPDSVREAVIKGMDSAAPYCEVNGMIEARRAIADYHNKKKFFPDVTPEDIYIGNGVSELVQMSMLALLNYGDEILIPQPDYPIWSNMIHASGGHPVYYTCDEQAGWMPDVADIRAKITPRTKAILIINPNNPTGALYPDSLLLEIIAIAREHGLIIYADEVYDKVLYDGATHTAIGSLSEDVLTVSFNGLSKNYRSCGYRAGWMFVSGDRSRAHDYIEGLDMLASMRLCANVPGQYGIQTALGGYQSIDDLVAPGGRLYQQRDLAYELITAIPGVSCVKPKATLYMFPRLDPKMYPIKDDQAFIADLLREERVLLVQGTGFNWSKPDHFRLVFLPHEGDLRDALARIGRFLDSYRKKHGN